MDRRCSRRRICDFLWLALGRELPAAAEPLAHSLGFVVATGLLHLVGIGFGSLIKWPVGRIAVRAGDRIIRIHGSKSVLQGAVLADQAKHPGVRGFIRNWRAQRDSNPCFRRERATSWTARRWAREGAKSVAKPRFEGRAEI